MYYTFGPSTFFVVLNFLFNFIRNVWLLLRLIRLRALSSQWTEVKAMEKLISYRIVFVIMLEKLHSKLEDNQYLIFCTEMIIQGKHHF